MAIEMPSSPSLVGSRPRSPPTSPRPTCLSPPPGRGPGAGGPTVLRPVTSGRQAGQGPVRLAKALRRLNRPKCSARGQATCKLRALGAGWPVASRDLHRLNEGLVDIDRPRF